MTNDLIRKTIDEITTRLDTKISELNANPQYQLPELPSQVTPFNKNREWPMTTSFGYVWEVSYVAKLYREGGHPRLSHTSCMVMYYPIENEVDEKNRLVLLELNPNINVRVPIFEVNGVCATNNIDNAIDAAHTQLESAVKRA